MSTSDSAGQMLLASDALSGLRIAVSVSESADLGRLGLHETHFRLALGEIARSILVSGGKLAYGGHLQPDGYTTFLVQELQRYSRRDRPLRICLAASEHVKLTPEDLLHRREELGLFGEIVCLDGDGQPVDPSGIRLEASDPADALTGLRRYMTQNASGRVLIGGKRAGFQGTMPGLFEEALYSLEAGQPLYVAGGFGGAAFDIVRVIDIDAARWLPDRPDIAPDSRLSDGLRALSELVGDKGWAALNNGLTVVENAILSATPRPSEIAALISLGMGRRFVAT